MPLTGNRVGAAGAVGVAELMAVCPKLVRVELTSELLYRVTRNAALSLSDSTSPLCQAANGMGAEGLSKVATKVPDMSLLQYLDLRSAFLVCCLSAASADLMSHTHTQATRLMMMLAPTGLLRCWASAASMWSGWSWEVSARRELQSLAARWAAC